MLAIVSTFSKTFDEIGIIYFIPNFLENKLEAGMIVEVAIKEKIEYGIVLEIGTEDTLLVKIDNDKLKSIIDIKNENVFLNKSRIELLNFIAANYFTPIHNATNLFFPKNLKEKIEKNKLNFVNNSFNYTFHHKKDLSLEQTKAYNKIKSSKNKKILLHGVTGSGKTEIYIKLIKDNLDKNKQSLLLIPEIILTNQLETRLKDVFGEQIISINSSITEAQKTKHWIDIYTGNAKIIIGTRSSLFYPYNNLGLIIIDEEHDNSYKSDISPRYKSTEIAEKISELNNIELILGSGTPSVNTMYKALKGEYNLVSLLKKYN